MDEDIKFNDLLFKALDHAIDSVSTGEILVPFVLTPSTIQRFATVKLENAIIEAEKYINSHKNESIIALAYDGYVTVSGEKFDAVFSKGFDRVNNKEVIIAQRYKPVASGKFEIIGNPAQIK